MIKHIVSFSGGKDSTAMLLMMLEKKMQIDDIIFCDTGMEFPELYKHIDLVENYIGRDITTIKADKSFKYYLLEHKKSRGKFKDIPGYGWPHTVGFRWCTDRLKIQVFNKYFDKVYPNEEIKRYIGIAYDEEKRIKSYDYPLVDWKITGKAALEYCYSKGFFWDGLYKDLKRVSCYCCPLANKKNFEVLYHRHPKLWNELKEWDDQTNPKIFWNSNQGITDLEREFRFNDLTIEKFKEWF